MKDEQYECYLECLLTDYAKQMLAEYKMLCAEKDCPQLRAYKSKWCYAHTKVKSGLLNLDCPRKTARQWLDEV